MSGLSASGSARWSASYVWSGGDTTLTVTLGSRSFGQDPTVGAGALVFDPTNVTSTLLSASGGYHVCDTNTAGSDCLADVSGAV